MKKILVADDDPAICDVIRLMLEDEGYWVVTTIDGEVIKNITEDLPDLILLDIWMSGVDGREICKQLKTQNDTKHIPVVLVSASSNIVQSARDAGANDFVEKPFHMEELLGKVSKWLSATN